MKHVCAAYQWSKALTPLESLVECRRCTTQEAAQSMLRRAQALLTFCIGQQNVCQLLYGLAWICSMRRMLQHKVNVADDRLLNLSVHVDRHGQARCTANLPPTFPPSEMTLLKLQPMLLKRRSQCYLEGCAAVWAVKTCRMLEGERRI